MRVQIERLRVVPRLPKDKKGYYMFVFKSKMTIIAFFWPLEKKTKLIEKRLFVTIIVLNAVRIPMMDIFFIFPQNFVKNME